MNAAKPAWAKYTKQHQIVLLFFFSSMFDNML